MRFSTTVIVQQYMSNLKNEVNENLFQRSGHRIIRHGFRVVTGDDIYVNTGIEAVRGVADIPTAKDCLPPDVVAQGDVMFHDGWDSFVMAVERCEQGIALG